MSERRPSDREIDAHFTLDLRDTIEKFLERIPGDGAKSIKIPLAYPGLMLGLESAIHQESGKISVERDESSDTQIRYTVRLTDPDDQEYAQLGMLVDIKTNQPIVTLGSSDVSEEAFLSTMLEDSMDKFLELGN